ncbi:MAG TPA: D-alanyl-D-alanine carboxypeptidase, partial [bacterium]|nr:D-alanyl-D-alanine carboxypeptidase [bacterium]
GSGLDERNKMTTRAQVRLLEYMYRDFRYASDYIASLSIGGIDGTEKKRFIKRKDESSLIGTTRLKVGFLYGVSGLSGYIETQSKDIIAFSILTNGYPKEYYETMRQFEDRIVKALGGL